MAKVQVWFVNGDYQEYQEDHKFVERLLALQRDGYKGKNLIENLITDDWGPPPSTVIISGTSNSGIEVNLSILYE